ncbi:MAG: DUF4870 domain-containing protein [Phycisphaerales bacterium]|nr:MAG: DUF4870 domain-containing protein [Phycisphaerales bacterium]
MAETERTGSSQRSPEGQPSAFTSRAGQGVQQPEMSRDARNMAMLCHLLGIFGFFGPLLIWLIERDKHRFVDEHGRAAMNYQVSFLVYLTALCVTLIGTVLIPVLLVVHIALSIVATVKASRGEPWLYPIAIAFLK